DGETASLQIQVKRTVTFAPSDTVFRDVVRQLAQAIRSIDVSDRQHQFAVATQVSTLKIAGSYQDLLRWAREVGSASTFFTRVERKHVGNDDMRSFVATFKTHLSEEGISDDETAWQILRRFQILSFDFNNTGSLATELMVERAQNVLVPEERSKAIAFIKT